MALSDPSSFIDLRQFVAEHERLPSPSDDFEAGRHILDLTEGPVSVGLWQLGSSTGRVDLLNADEFLIVTRGTLSITSADGQLVLTTGQSAVLPKGSSFSWEAPSPTTAVFMRVESEATRSATAPVAIDVSAPLTPSKPPLADLLIGPTPSCRSHSDFTSASGEFACGTWDSTPYHRGPMFYPHYELMLLLEGSVAFEDSNGNRATFHKGDIFLLTQGSTCSWLSEVHVKKIFALYRPS